MAPGGFARLSRWSNSIWVGAAIAAPVVAILVWVWNHSLVIPFLDDWHIVVDLGRLEDGQLGTLAYIWQQHNEHRMGALKVISLLSIALSPAYYYKIATMMGFTLTLVTLLLVTDMIRIIRPRSVVLLVCASLLLFSPIYNALWNHVAASIPYRSLLLSLALLGWALTRWPGQWPGTIWAAGACLLATFSAGSGLALWGMAIICLLAYQAVGVGRNLPRQILFMVITALTFITLYFANYQEPAGTVELRPLEFVLSQPVYFLQTVIALLGKPFITEHGTRNAALMGLVGIFLLGVVSLGLALFRSRRTVVLVPLLLLALFAILNATAAVYFRSHEDLEWLVSAGRYFLPSYFFWLGIFVFICCLTDELGKRWDPVIFASTSSLLILAMLVSTMTANMSAWQSSTQFLKDMKKRDLALIRSVHQFESAPESNIPEIGWWVSKEFLRELKRQQLSVFAEPLLTVARNAQSQGRMERSQRQRQSRSRARLGISDIRSQRSAEPITPQSPTVRETRARRQSPVQSSGATPYEAAVRRLIEPSRADTIDEVNSADEDDN